MEAVNLIRVFIASPGDVKAEREAVVKACERANIELGDYLKIRVEPIRWETHTYPQYDENIQKAIFNQIDFARLDLFVGILAGRFGTPAEDCGSGTEAEFKLAVDLHTKHKRPHIMLYFGDKTVPDTQEDANQRSKVLSFRDSLKQALYQRYMQVNGRAAEDVFADMFRTHLFMWLTNIAPPPPRAVDVPEEFKIIHLIMNDFEWYHLLQLWKDNPHQYQHSEGLEREMRSLERLQLIRFKNQASRWDRLPHGEFLLRDHVELTEFGRRFMGWRRQFPPYNEVW